MAQHIPCTFETMTSKATAFNDINVAFASPLISTRDEASPHNVSSSKESWLEVFLPFSTNYKLREMMLCTDKQSVKLSRLLEILDSMAGDVCMKHTKTKRTKNGFDKTLVTASVSGLTSCSRIDIMKNYSLQGYVSYVGTSSMEVSIEIVQDPLTPNENSLSKIFFTMVALDPTTNKAIPVPQLLLESDVERKLFERGKNRVQQKRLKAKDSLTLKGPRDDETQLIHQLYLDSIRLREEMNEFHKKRHHFSHVDNGNTGEKFNMAVEAPNKNMKWVKHTTHKNILLMHSQNMNVNGKIFGGYIMRKSFELAHLSATLFYGTNDIQFCHVDDIQFVKPVHVGSVIEFDTNVAYSRRGYCVTHCNCYETGYCNKHTNTNECASLCFQSV